MRAQRQYYKNKTEAGGTISDKRIAQLNAIGFDWSLSDLNPNCRPWEDKYQLLCAFQRENGHCRVPSQYAIDSVNLGQWVCTQRKFYKNLMNGKTEACRTITDERIAQLNSIGFEWRSF